MEWASEGNQVNATSPGNIPTLTAHLPRILPWHDKWDDKNLMGRLGEVEDLQGAVVYLRSTLTTLAFSL